MLNLDFTGHPYFDVGLAAITAHADKGHPTDLTEEDLDKAATFIETYYTQQPLTSFLTASLLNSDFTQPAFKDKPERRLAYARLVGRSFGSDVPMSDEVCVFTGEPALGVALSLKVDKNGRPELPPGRVYRQHVPLVTGEGIINFSPYGDPGLPVSGKALLCLQFFPMGCRKCCGRLLAVHSDNHAILLVAAREAWLENERGITLARATGEAKLPDASPSAPTLIVETLVSMDLARTDARKDQQPYSVTAYHLTNSGQSSALDEKSPPLKIYHLPMPIVRFLGKVNHPRYGSTWNLLVARGQVTSKPAKGKRSAKNAEVEGKKEDVAAPNRGRNYFFEDLLDLPNNTHRFILKYFLRAHDLHTRESDARESAQREKKCVPWSFIVLFLREVLSMDKKRIEGIGRLGERLAAYVKEFDDKRFFSKFYELQRGDYFRNELLRAIKNATSHGKPPLIRFEEFCDVFFEGDDDDLRLDWKLTRDLMLIRMFEWFSDHDSKLQERVKALTEREIELDAHDNE